MAPTPVRDTADSMPLEEWAALDMMRCLFIGHADDDTYAWGAAMTRGDWYFQSPVSGPLLVALADMIDAFRARRRSTFMFSDPRRPCRRACVTACERLVVDLISAQRRGDRRQAGRVAETLCETGDTGDVLAAAVRVATILDAAVGAPDVVRH